MQAGRELDAKVAEALGYQGVKYGVDDFGEYAYMISSYGPSLGRTIQVPRFSTTWEGMGVLVEEARQQGIHLEFSHGLTGGYYGYSGTFVDGEYQTDHATENAVSTAPHAICLVFLQAKGIAT